MELFSLDPGLAIWTWIAFGALLFILWKFVFPSLMGSLKNREILIARSVDEADEIHRRLDQINTEYAEVIKKAEKEADALLLKTRKDAEVLKGKLAAEAEKEAAAIVARGRIKAAEERQALLQTLQEELAEFVLETSEKIIGSSFTTEKDREFSREMAESL